MAEYDPKAVPPLSSLTVEDRAHLTWLRLPYVIAGLAVIYGISIIVFSGYDLFRFFHCTLISIGSSILVSYSQGVWSSNLTYRGKLLVAGILCTWTATVFQQINVTILQDGYGVILPINWFSNVAVLINTLAYFSITVGGVLHLAAPNALVGNIPDANWLALGRSIGMAVFGFLAITYFDGLALWFGQHWLATLGAFVMSMAAAVLYQRSKRKNWNDA